jgi:hypothetical protein
MEACVTEEEEESRLLSNLLSPYLITASLALG